MTPDLMIELLENSGYEPRSYSGRGMYGKNCVGVVVEDVFALGVAVGQESRHYSEDIPSAKTDSMGRDIIVYWPDLAWPEDGTEED